MNDRKECRMLEPQLALYACDELEGQDRAMVEQHLASCKSCAAWLERERALVIAVAESAGDAVDSDALLAQCRAALSEALDRESRRFWWRRWLAGLRPSHWADSLRGWVVAHPAWSAAVFALFGFALGQAAGPIGPGNLNEFSASPVMTVRADTLSDQELENATVSGVNWMLSGNGNETPTVEVRLRAERPVVLRGTAVNDDVRKVLLRVVRDDRLFDAGLRLDSLEVLRGHAEDKEVREALFLAARKDRDTAVRLKALEALRGLEGDARVREVFLEAMIGEANPGVRIAAVNALRAWADRHGVLAAEGRQVEMPSDPELVEVLNDLIQKDPNICIRVQSAGLIRELASSAQATRKSAGPREKH